MIAWKLSTDFNEQKHLFSEIIKTDYMIEAYICTCGHTDFIIRSQEQSLKYRCQECENMKFNDANSALKNIRSFLYQNQDLKLSYEYEIQSSDENISSIYLVQIPSAIKFSNRQIIFSKKPVYTLTLSADGKFNENYLLSFNEVILSKLQYNLIQYINKNSCFNVPNSEKKKLTLSRVSFFLENENLKCFDFYYWNKMEEFKSKNINIDGALESIPNYPKAKSVRKAYYKHYLRQLCDDNCFSSSFLEAFCNNIKDTNILVKLLNLVFSPSLSENIDGLLNFLIKHYSDKQILKLFSSIKIQESEHIFNDAVSEFHYSNGAIESKFRKVACKIQLLHDEFLRCTKEERHKYLQDEILSYSEEAMKPCVEVNTYQVKLPKTGEELFNWADRLHNCMAGYFDMIKNNETIIYVFFQKNTIAFAVEIRHEEVAQASGNYNSELSIEETDVLNKWFELFFKKYKQRLEYVA